MAEINIVSSNVRFLNDLGALSYHRRTIVVPDDIEKDHKPNKIGRSSSSFTIKI